MRNNMSKKILASLMIALLGLSNVAFAVTDKPVLREDENEYSLQLKGDVSYVKNETPISMSLRDSDVKQVLRMFADKAGLNIIFHDSVKGNVTLDLVDVPLNSAFEMVMGITNLNYMVQDNTMVVVKADVKDFNMAKQDMTLIPVKYVSATAMADFLNKNIYAINKPGLSSTDIVTTNPATNELIVFGSKNDVAIAKKIVEKFDQKPKTTVFKVNHTTPEQMANMICEVLIPSTGGSTGGAPTGGAAGIMTGAAVSPGGGGSTASGDTLVLNEGVVACTLDGKTAGSVTSLGLQNLTVAYYSQLGTINVTGGSEQQLEMIKDYIATTDRKQTQAYLEVSIIELNEDGSKDLTNTWQFNSSAFSAKFDSNGAGTDPLYPIFFKGKGYTLYDGTDYPYETIGEYGKWKGPVTISYAINYLIKNGKAKVVVNPKIVITNGVESVIEVTQDYVESVDIDVSTTNGAVVTTKDYNIEEDLGVTVSITPFISPDGYVTLNIVPEYSTELERIQDSINTGGSSSSSYIAATLLTHRNLDLKNIRIKDGETLVIAGMIQEREHKSVTKVPVLGDLPIIGAMFRNTSTSKAKSEMVMMITPKIITDTEDAVGNTDAL